MLTAAAPPIAAVKDSKSTEIHVHSIDADGCVFNMKYHRDKCRIESQRILKNNSVLIKHITDSAKDQKIDDITLISGSMRQSAYMDQNIRGWNRTASSFSMLKLLTDELSIQLGILCRLDKFILKDLQDIRKNKKYLGYNFDFVESGGRFRERYDCDGYDLNGYNPQKISLLYIQIQKFAFENPGTNIQFNFYDDKEEILTKLSAFFSNNPDLIPENVTLNLFLYNEKSFRPANKPIIGKGNIDGAFSSTIDYVIAKSKSKYDGVGNFYELENSAPLFREARKQKYSGWTIDKNQGKYKTNYRTSLILDLFELKNLTDAVIDQSCFSCLPFVASAEKALKSAQSKLIAYLSNEYYSPFTLEEINLLKTGSTSELLNKYKKYVEFPKEFTKENVSTNEASALLKA